MNGELGVLWFVVVVVFGGVRQTMGREKGGKREKERAKGWGGGVVERERGEKDRSTHKHKHKLDL